MSLVAATALLPASEVRYLEALRIICACSFVSSKTPCPKPRMVITPTSSRKTREGEWICRAFFAAATAFWAALRMAEITADCPARTPAAMPNMAFSPTERSELVMNAAEIADSRFVTVAAASAEKSYSTMPTPIPAEMKPPIGFMRWDGE